VSGRARIVALGFYFLWRKECILCAVSETVAYKLKQSGSLPLSWPTSPQALCDFRFFKVDKTRHKAPLSLRYIFWNLLITLSL